MHRIFSCLGNFLLGLRQWSRFCSGITIRMHGHLDRCEERRAEEYDLIP